MVSVPQVLAMQRALDARQRFCLKHLDHPYESPMKHSIELLQVVLEEYHNLPSWFGFPEYRALRKYPNGETTEVYIEACPPEKLREIVQSFGK